MTQRLIFLPFVLAYLISSVTCQTTSWIGEWITQSCSSQCLCCIESVIVTEVDARTININAQFSCFGIDSLVVDIPDDDVLHIEYLYQTYDLYMSTNNEEIHVIPSGPLTNNCDVILTNTLSPTLSPSLSDSPNGTLSPDTEGTDLYLTTSDTTSPYTDEEMTEPNGDRYGPNPPYLTTSDTTSPDTENPLQQDGVIFDMSEATEIGLVDSDECDRPHPNRFIDSGVPPNAIIREKCVSLQYDTKKLLSVEPLVANVPVLVRLFADRDIVALTTHLYPPDQNELIRWRGNILGCKRFGRMFVTFFIEGGVQGQIHCDMEFYAFEAVTSSFSTLRQIDQTVLPSEVIPPVLLRPTPPPTDTFQATDNAFHILLILGYDSCATVDLTLLESHFQHQLDFIWLDFYGIQTVVIFKCVYFVPDKGTGVVALQDYIEFLKSDSEVENLRLTYEADFVSLVLNVFPSEGFCGLTGYVPDVMNGDPINPYSVTFLSCCNMYYTLIHELGHGMGLAHESEPGGGCNYSGFDSGSEGGLFMSVMSTDTRCEECSRLPFYSDETFPEYELGRFSQNAVPCNKQSFLQAANMHLDLGLCRSKPGEVRLGNELTRYTTRDRNGCCFSCEINKDCELWAFSVANAMCVLYNNVRRISYSTKWMYGEIERDCGEKLRCGTRCISPYQLCDGVVDCADESDEEQCQFIDLLSDECENSVNVFRKDTSDTSLSPTFCGSDFSLCCVMFEDYNSKFCSFFSLCVPMACMNEYDLSVYEFALDILFAPFVGENIAELICDDSVDVFNDKQCIDPSVGFFVTGRRGENAGLMGWWQVIPNDLHNGRVVYTNTGLHLSFNAGQDIWQVTYSVLDGGRYALIYTDAIDIRDVLDVVCWHFWNGYEFEEDCGVHEIFLSEECCTNRLSMIGDGWCDWSEYNVEECSWDGGDCCESTCTSGDWDCGSTPSGYNCIDPNALENQK